MNILEKIRSFANKPSIRITSLAILMSAGKVSLANKLEKDFNKKPNQTEIGFDEDSKKAISSLSKEEIMKMDKNSKFELIKLKLNVNYETDKAELSEQNKMEISQQFINFLDNINEDNFDIAQNAIWSVFSACDERTTNQWGEKGNEALAKARGQVIIQILEEVLANHKFKLQDQEKILSLKNKKIENKIANNHSNRKGEILITDTINPDTGKKYTDKEVEEIKKNNPQRYQDELLNNRISEFQVEITVKKLQEIVSVEKAETLPANITFLNYEELVKKFSDYKIVINLFDNSSSMRDDKESLSQEIEKVQKNLEKTLFYVGHYSDKLYSMDLVNNDQNIKKEIMKSIGIGNNQERTIQAIISAWEQLSSKIKPDQKTLMAVYTDEPLQKFTKVELEKIINLPSNVKLLFIFPTKNINKNLIAIVPEVIVDHFNNINEENNKYLKEKIKEYETKLKETEKHLVNLKSKEIKIDNFSNKEKKEIQKHIEIVEKNKEYYLSSIKNLLEMFDQKEVTLKTFSDENGKIIHLNQYN